MLKINPRCFSFPRVLCLASALVAGENTAASDPAQKPPERNSQPQNSAQILTFSKIPGQKNHALTREERIQRNPIILSGLKPEEIFANYGLYRNHPAAKNLLTTATMKDPGVAVQFFNRFQGDPDMERYLDLSADARFMVSMEDNLWRKSLRSGKIKDLHRFLNEMVGTINPELPYALEEVNKKHKLSLKCMGIQREPFEFVFINTFEREDKSPFRIGITYPELKYNVINEDITSLLDRKVCDRKAALSEQYKIWATIPDFDLPKGGKTACVLIAVPENSMGKLTGIEGNFAELARIYTKYYEAEISAVCMQRPVQWLEAISEKGISNLPIVAPATKESILKHIDATLRRAIDDRKQEVVIHYMMHGGQDGGMDTQDLGLSASEIADVISREKDGMPMCALIQITILAMPSCYSESQTNLIVSSLKNKTTSDGKRTAVRDLKLINDSRSNTPSDGSGISSYNTLILNSRLAGLSSPTSVYYFSSYYNLCEYLTSEGTLSQPVGTFFHALRFADEMSWSSRFSQDLQGQRYSYDPDKDIESYQFFSYINGAPVLLTSK